MWYKCRDKLRIINRLQYLNLVNWGNVRNLKFKSKKWVAVSDYPIQNIIIAIMEEYFYTLNAH